VYGVDSYTIVFIGDHFLFTYSDTFAVIAGARELEAPNTTVRPRV